MSSPSDIISKFYGLYLMPTIKGSKDSDYRIMETQYKSYETFREDLKDIFERDEKIYYRSVKRDTTVTGKIVIENFRMEPQKSNKNIITPRMARITGNTLYGDVYADMKQVLIVETTESPTSVNTKSSVNTAVTTKEYVIAEDKNTKLISVPLLVLEGGRTSLNKNDFNDYSSTEFGGYFIIKGNEKIPINSTSTIPNRPRISEDKGVIKLYIKSIRENKQVQHISIKINKRNSNIVTFSSQLMADVNVFVLIRYFQLKDKVILDLITNNDPQLKRLAMKWLSDSKILEETNKDGTKTRYNELDYIMHKLKRKDDKKQAVSIRDYFENDFLPHLNTTSLPDKGVFLCYLVKKLLLCCASGSAARYYDKDSFLGKQFLTVGYYLKYIVRNTMNKLLEKNIEIFKQAEKNSNKSVLSLLEQNRIQDIRNILSTFTTSEITNDICVLVSIGTFTYYSVIVNVERYSAFLVTYTARRITKSLRQPKQAITKMLDARDFHISSVGFLDPNETPEHGASVGLTLSLSLVASISSISDRQERLVHEKIVAFYDKHKEDIDATISSEDTHRFMLILESRILGFIKEEKAFEFYAMLRHEKRLGNFLEDDIGIVYDYCEKEIRINTFGGRLTKPVMLFADNGIDLAVSVLSKSEYEEFTNLKSFTELFERFPHVYEIIDIEQFIYSMVCQDTRSLEENKLKYEQARANRVDNTVGIYTKYELMEAPGDLLSSVTASAILCPNSIQGTRVIFGTSQIKGTATFATPDFNNTLGNGLFLPAPERPLIISKAFTYTRLVNIGFGQHAMLALMPYFGMEKDDAVIVKRSSVQCGFLTCISSKKYVKQLDKGNEANSDKNCIRVSKNYGKLNSNGYPNIGTIIEKDDVIVKNIVPITKKESTGELITIDNSEIYLNSYPGVLASHAINVHTNKKEHRMQINSFRSLVAGDKIGTRSAQKGTISKLVDDHLLPYDEDGIRPDIIGNPLAIANRKTSSFWLECMLNACIIESNGVPIDFSTFEGTYQDCIDYAKKILGPLLGEKQLYDPITHKKQQVTCIMTALYYSASRHKVEDKAYGRAKGAINQITRQANGGRGKGGGLKFGEMERDCILGQGAAYTLHGLLSDSYDNQTYLYVCINCGMFTRHFKDVFGQEREVCMTCENSEIVKYKVPYVFLTLLTENLARGQVIKLKTELSKTMIE